MSLTSGARRAQSANHTPNRRTIAEVQEKITGKRERGLFSRLAHAKNDKEVVATWRSDLNRVLHVFNVCSTASFQQSLTPPPQTELAIGTHIAVSDTHAIASDTHVMVSDTHAMVSDLHSQHLSVGMTLSSPITEHSPPPRLKPGQ